MKYRCKSLVAAACVAFIFLNGCAHWKTSELSNETEDPREAKVNVLLESSLRDKGPVADTARADLVKSGEESVPYLANILKKRKGSEDLDGTIFTTRIGVYILNERNDLRNDYAATAASVLAEIGGNAIPILVDLAKDKRVHFQVRWRALVGIGFMTQPAPRSVSELLVSMLADENMLLREMAMGEIGNLLVYSAKPELEKRLTDSNASVRELARTALLKLEEGMKNSPPAHSP
jgi:HEAT repeat protein